MVSTFQFSKPGRGFTRLVAVSCESGAPGLDLVVAAQRILQNPSPPLCPRQSFSSSPHWRSGDFAPVVVWGACYGAWRDRGDERCPWIRMLILHQERSGTGTIVDKLRALFLLRSDVTYLNHGSFGACPRPVFEAYQRWQLELEREPTQFLVRRSRELMQSARSALGDFVGAPAQDLVYVPNATTGLNALARSLHLKPGEEVLSTNHEYGAMDRMWGVVCRRRGAVYRRQPVALPASSKDEIVETVWSGVTDRTRVLFLSHISSPTALVFPIEPLISRARGAGIVTIIDGAHGPGQMDLSLQNLDADFYVGNCHKWMLAPKGAAFLYARPDCQAMLQPLIVSWGGKRPGLDHSPFIDEFEYQGTRDIASYLAVPAALRFLSEYRWDQVGEHCRQLLRDTRRRIGALTGLPPNTPDTDTWYRQMCTIPLPACDARALQQRLFHDFAIEVPVFNWQERQFLRVSIQGYNEQADVDALVAALEALLP